MSAKTIDELKLEQEKWWFMDECGQWWKFSKVEAAVLGNIDVHDMGDPAVEVSVFLTESPRFQGVYCLTQSLKAKRVISRWGRLAI